MRKHSVRKWLHAVLDLLPVLILPVFAIYEINHDHNEPISVEVSQNQVVNFNQVIDNNFVLNSNSLYGDGSTNRVKNNDYIEFDTTASSGYIGSFTSFYNTLPNHYYVERFMYEADGDINLLGVAKARSISYTFISDNGLCATRFLDTGGANQTFIARFNNSSIGVHVSISRTGFNLYDLTEMYGEGNEPTLSEFLEQYPLSYYDYNTGTKQLIKDVDTITYADTDVGSQMIYSLYKPVVNYFNFNNVFNFGAIYDWFQLNMFNGNAPMVAFIVWNIIVYEFIMDILFLVYSVFMFLIDFAEGTLEKFTGWCTRG